MKPLIPIICLLAMLAVSGCVVIDQANEGWCQANGGTWMEKYGECCPKGCPTDPIENPDTSEDIAITQRCQVCWLP